MKFDDILVTGKVWVTSDIHHSHKNICRGVTNWRTQDGQIPINSTRDFQTIDEMNDVLVNNINSKVGQYDTFIMLGDISFGGFENVGKFLDRLVCKNIHLVLGNHDHHIRNNQENIQERFSSVSDYLQVKIYGQNFVMCHYPFSSWNGLNKGSIHLYGHIHSGYKNKFGNGKKMDVGVDGNNYHPYSLSEIVHMMDRIPISSEIDNDHHLDNLVGIVG